MGDLSWWLEVKRWLVELLALERDALHIYFAVAIQLLTVWSTPWQVTQFRSLLPLLLLELVNEYADLRYEVWPGTDRVLQWSASAHDVFNTLALPAVIVLIARHYARVGGGLQPGHSHAGCGEHAEQEQHPPAPGDDRTP